MKMTVSRCCGSRDSELYFLNSHAQSDLKYSSNIRILYTQNVFTWICLWEILSSCAVIAEKMEFAF
jgi:hypothetical protein